MRFSLHIGRKHRESYKTYRSYEGCLQVIRDPEVLNTTARHPECDGVVERFNCTLTTMHRNQAAERRAQSYIHGVV